MSIVIDGIEQPKDCAHCRFVLNQDYCIAAKKYIPHEVLISLQRAEFCTARSVVRGKWEIDNSYAGPGLMNLHCSVCGEFGGTWRDCTLPSMLYKFCPNCGAMMGHYNGK